MKPSIPATDLLVTVDELTGNPENQRVELPLVDDWSAVALPVTRTGCYRVCVTGEDVEPANDLFVMAPSRPIASPPPQARA